ncbi:hypothetical protein B0H12DRAFT_1077763 [Mycena haematopus]|nr:hypothetical protein B0H12DRAFT_1077763 [Mycena haematopus]
MPASRPDYTRQPGLENHPGTILALALTTDGKTLITGGSAGTRAWDSKTLAMMARPDVAGVRGATTVLLCVRRVDKPVDMIFSGTANGYIFCWRSRKGKWEETFALQIDQPTDITGIAFDASTDRLIVCSSDGKVVAWGVTRDESTRVRVSMVFSRQIMNFAPRAIAFAGFDTSKDKDILVFGENHTGPIYKLRGNAGEIVEEWTVGGAIGDAQVDWKEGVVLFDDIFAGPSLRSYHDYTRVKMYFIRATRNYGRIRNVRFAEGSTAVVCGSDHGLVYVFNLQTGEPLQKLDTETGEWVQTVATADVDDVPTVFAAPTRSEDGDVTLCVWKRLEPEPEVTLSKFWKTTWWYLIRIIVVCCCIGFLLQNLQGLLGVANMTGNIKADAQEVGGEIRTNEKSASTPWSRACPQEGLRKKFVREVEDPARSAELDVRVTVGTRWARAGSRSRAAGAGMARLRRTNVGLNRQRSAIHEATYSIVDCREPSTASMRLAMAYGASGIPPDAVVNWRGAVGGTLDGAGRRGTALRTVGSLVKSTPSGPTRVCRREDDPYYSGRLEHIREFRSGKISQGQGGYLPKTEPRESLKRPSWESQETGAADSGAHFVKAPVLRKPRDRNRRLWLTAVGTVTSSGAPTWADPVAQDRTSSGAQQVDQDDTPTVYLRIREWKDFARPKAKRQEPPTLALTAVVTGGVTSPGAPTWADPVAQDSTSSRAQQVVRRGPAAQRTSNHITSGSTPDPRPSNRPGTGRDFSRPVKCENVSNDSLEDDFNVVSED